MGSCISKFKPKKKAKEEDNQGRHHVQHKLIISRGPPPEITIMPLHKPLSPAPSTSSTASFSSFSCSATASSVSSSSSSSSSLSSSSSASYSVSKDRSFSNEFLWSYAKENPRAVGLNVEKTALFPNKILSTAPTPKKRARAASPTLVRQKSFRKERNSPNRSLRSPSPSRKFNGDGNRIFPFQESNYYRKSVVSRVSNAAPKRESFRTAALKRELSIAPKMESFRAPKLELRKIDAFSEYISSKIDGNDVDVWDGGH